MLHQLLISSEEKKDEQAAPTPTTERASRASYFYRLNATLHNIDEAISPARSICRTRMITGFILLLGGIGILLIKTNTLAGDVALPILACLIMVGGVCCIATGATWFCRNNHYDTPDDYALIVANHYNYNQIRTSVEALAIEVKDNNPFVLRSVLEKKSTEMKDTLDKKISFLMGSHPRLNLNSSLGTLFNNMGGQKGKTREAICNKIFEYAGLSLK